MNDKNFEFDPIQPIEPISPFYNDTVSVENQAQKVEQPQYTYMEPSAVTPVEPPLNRETFNVNSYAEMPNVSNTEAPIIDQEINENPNAKISLRKEEEVEVESNLPREKMDRGTFWMLIWLFIGLLVVIIALPYVYELF